jgi:hypothetical protein
MAAEQPKTDVKPGTVIALVQVVEPASGAVLASVAGVTVAVDGGAFVIGWDQAKHFRHYLRPETHLRVITSHARTGKDEVWSGSPDVKPEESITLAKRKA